MGIQLIAGASGTGKSEYIKNYVAREAFKNRKSDINYIMLVPEQFTSELQREMINKFIEINKVDGFMNIDIIGFNRLAFKVFEELQVKTNNVLEDFGKSMFVRAVAGKLKDELKVYGSSVDKLGFVDEIKSIMSEFFTCCVSEEDIKKIIDDIEADSGASSEKKHYKDEVLHDKLSDIVLIYEEFKKMIEDNYVTNEQMTEILASHIKESEFIRNSVIVMDGYTGFTPVQLRVIQELMLYAKDVKITFTIDEENIKKSVVKEHELYYLSRTSLDAIKALIDKNNVIKNSIESEDMIIFKRDGEINRFKSAPMISHLEKSIFRYPVNKYRGSYDTNDIEIWNCMNPKEEIRAIAASIKGNIKAGMRYKDMAVLTGRLEDISSYVERVFGEYDIPLFCDYNKKMRNNPYIDSIIRVLEIIDSNYDYESVFGFLKTGIINEFSDESIEMLESYAKSRGLRGHRNWVKSITSSEEGTEEVVREYFMNIVEPIYKCFHNNLKNKNKKTVTDYIDVLTEFMVNLNFEYEIDEKAKYFEENGEHSVAGAYRRLYGRITALFEKMKSIMPDEVLSVTEFHDILKVGMDEISMGIIPPTQDMVVVGDLNRTRLSDVKIIYIMNVNDSVIPRNTGSSTKLITDREKERMLEIGNASSEHSFELAPTDKVNTFMEQYYLYLMMTKPSQKLVMTYSNLDFNNASLNPAYLVDRVKAIFDGLKVRFIDTKRDADVIGTYKSDIHKYTGAMRKIFESDASSEISDEDDIKEAAIYHKLYSEIKSEEASSGSESGINSGIIDKVKDAVCFDNGAKNLSTWAINSIVEVLKQQSVSKLEKYAGCPYSYFLKYGLGIKEEREFKIALNNVGDIVHKALKDTFEIVKKKHNNEWDKMPEKDLVNLMKDNVDKAYSKYYEDEKKEALIAASGRNAFVVEHIYKVAETSIKNIKYQMDNGKMQPTYFEFKFSGDGYNNANIKFDKYFGKDEKTKFNSIPLTGIIDRGDINKSEDEDDNKVYFRAVDYKTGYSDFNIEDIYEGLKLQLVVYSSILKEVIEKDYPETEGVPVGMYYHGIGEEFIDVDDTVVKNGEIKDEKKYSTELNKELKLRGIPNSNLDIQELQEIGIKSKRANNEEITVLSIECKKDGSVKSGYYEANTDELNNIFEFGQKKMTELSENILNGNIKKRPVKKSENYKKCDSCAYKEICRFDAGNESGSRSENRYKYVNPKAGAKKKMWAEMTTGSEKSDDLK